jgi:hypothetical protein
MRAIALFAVVVSFTGCFLFDPSPPDDGRGGGVILHDGGANDGAVNHVDASTPGDDGGTSGNVRFSGPLNVEQMNASMSAQSYGPDVRVYASLLYPHFAADPSPDYVVLDSGDSLVAHSGTLTMTMTRETNTGSEVVYVAIFPQQSTAVDVVIQFSRTNGKSGAPYSKVTLPAPYTVTSTAPASVKRGVALPIKVSAAFASSVSTGLDITGACITEHDGAVVFDATGATSFDTALLQFIATPPPAAGCAIAVRVQAGTTGQVDSAFRRGTLGAIDTMPGFQDRDTATQLTP